MDRMTPVMPAGSGVGVRPLLLLPPLDWLPSSSSSSSSPATTHTQAHKHVAHDVQTAGKQSANGRTQMPAGVTVNDRETGKLPSGHTDSRIDTHEHVSVGECLCARVCA